MYVYGPVVAPVLCEDPSDFGMGSHCLEPVGVGMHKFIHKIGDGWDAYEVMERFHWSHFEDSSDFPNTFILGNLESAYEAFLVDASVPYLSPIGEGRDDKGIVDLAPVEEV